jgi:hypothetical protein
MGEIRNETSEERQARLDAGRASHKQSIRQEEVRHLMKWADRLILLAVYCFFLPVGTFVGNMLYDKPYSLNDQIYGAAVLICASIFASTRFMMIAILVGKGD